MINDPGAIVDALATAGCHISRGCFGSQFDTPIETGAGLWGAGRFRPAAVGTGLQRSVRPGIRSDQIHWLDPAALPGAVKPYWEMIDALRLELNRTLYPGLRRFEAHFHAECRVTSDE